MPKDRRPRWDCACFRPACVPSERKLAWPTPPTGSTGRASSASMDSTPREPEVGSQEIDRQAGRDDRHRVEDRDEEKPVAKGVHPRRCVHVKAASVGDPDGDSHTGRQHHCHVASQKPWRIRREPSCPCMGQHAPVPFSMTTFLLQHRQDAILSTTGGSCRVCRPQPVSKSHPDRTSSPIDIGIRAAPSAHRGVQDVSRTVRSHGGRSKSHETLRLYRSQMRLCAQVAAVSAPPDKEKSRSPMGILISSSLGLSRSVRLYKSRVSEETRRCPARPKSASEVTAPDHRGLRADLLPWRRPWRAIRHAPSLAGTPTSPPGSHTRA